MFSESQFSRAPNVFVALANVLFFVAIQCAFFWFIASTQYRDVVSEKVGIVNQLAKHDEDVADLIHAYKESDKVKKARELAAAERREAEQRNWERMKTVVLKPAIAVAVLLLLCGIYIYRSDGENRHAWTRSDSIALAFVLAAFSTELLFFYGTIKQHSHVGDAEIYRHLAFE